MAVRFSSLWKLSRICFSGWAGRFQDQNLKVFAQTHRGETLSDTRVMDLFRELFFEAEPIRRTARAIFYEAQLSFDAGLIEAQAAGSRGRGFG